MTSTLFTPFRLGALELKNRIVVSPMCQYAAVDGNASEWHKMHLGHLCVGGAALVMVEATGVRLEGRITPGCLALESDDNERALAAVVDSIRTYSKTPLGIQLAHAGRKASCAPPWLGGALISSTSPGGWQRVAPSALSFKDDEPPPVALDGEGLARTKRGFVQAAERAVRIGFDVVELHCAHGYLMHQFLSPLSNLRTDDYGGSLANRTRFPLEVFEAVRDVVKGPLGVRVSATDWVEGGWSVDDTVAFAKLLKARGCDFVDVSSGGLSMKQQIAAGPGFQVPFAARVKEEAGVATIAVGMLTEPKQCDDVVKGGSADLVALARGHLWDPRFAWHAAEALGDTAPAPPQYLLARRGGVLVRA